MGEHGIQDERAPTSFCRCSSAARAGVQPGVFMGSWDQAIQTGDAWVPSPGGQIGPIRQGNLRNGRGRAGILYAKLSLFTQMDFKSPGYRGKRRPKRVGSIVFELNATWHLQARFDKTNIRSWAGEEHERTAGSSSLFVAVFIHHDHD